VEPLWEFAFPANVEGKLFDEEKDALIYQVLKGNGSLGEALFYASSKLTGASA